jgi:transposase
MNNGMSGEAVAKLIERKAHTVRNVYRRYLKTGIDTNKKRGNPNPKRKLNEEQIQRIREWIELNCTLTLNQLCNKCVEEWPQLVSISHTTVDKALKGMHYTFKRVSYVPETRNTPEVIAQRHEYALQYIRLKLENKTFLFIDEMGVQIWSRVSGGRALKGDRASKIVKRIRSRNYSICAAMASDSLYFFEIQDCAYNTEHFKQFISQLCDHLAADEITDAYLVMDNVRFHKTQEVRDLIEERGHNVLYLPPYSPFLDPIENLFSQWKGIVKREEPNDENELYDTVHILLK